MPTGFTEDDIVRRLAAFGTTAPAADESFVLYEELRAAEGESGHHGMTAAGAGKSLDASFSVVTEQDGGGGVVYTLLHPIVSTPSGTVVPDGDYEDLEEGTYYCHVRVNKTGSYDAVVNQESDDDTGEGGDDPLTHVVTVKICTLVRNDETGGMIVSQYHVGAVVVSAQTAPAKGSGLVINDDGEIDLDGREDEDEFKVIELKNKDDEVIAKVLATDEFGVTAGVESVNDLTGALHLIGGPHIRVTEEGKTTIKISYDEDKEEDDPNPEDEDSDPCEHPGDNNDGEGGVDPDGDEEDPGGGDGDDDGGVKGGGEPHIGDNGCQGPSC